MPDRPDPRITPDTRAIERGDSGAIVVATPFVVLMPLMCWALIKARSEDAAQVDAGRRRPDEVAWSSLDASGSTG